jgi:hypothetical protein
MLRRLARLVLVLVLLSGWTAGLLHPLKHTDEAGRLVHLHGGGNPAGAAADKLCDVLGALPCLPADSPPSAQDLGSRALTDASATFTSGGEAPPFFAQGPPALL